MCIYIELVCFLIAAIVPRSNNPLSFRHMALFQLTLLVSFGMEAGGTLHYKLDAIGMVLPISEMGRLSKIRLSKILHEVDSGSLVTKSASAKVLNVGSYVFLFRNMLSMERQRFKAQPLTRSCLPYEGPKHPPPTRNAASWQERRRVPYPKN